MSPPVVAKLRVELAALTMCLFACNELEHFSAAENPARLAVNVETHTHVCAYTHAHTHKFFSNCSLNYGKTNSTLHLLIM